MPALGLHPDRNARGVEPPAETAEPFGVAGVGTEPPADVPGLVQAKLGLSPTESEIAVLLAEGRTTREIAATTGRGYSTVRTHLKHIFTKLKSSRQFEVAQLVLALSSLPVSR